MQIDLEERGEKRGTRRPSVHLSTPSGRRSSGIPTPRPTDQTSDSTDLTNRGILSPPLPRAGTGSCGFFQERCSIERKSAWFQAVMPGHWACSAWSHAETNLAKRHDVQTLLHELNPHDSRFSAVGRSDDHAESEKQGSFVISLSLKDPAKTKGHTPERCGNSSTYS